jgi:hypothetical protein
MKRIILAFLLALGLSTSAQAVTLLNTTITTAVTAVVTQNFQIRPGPGGQFLPTVMQLQGTWTYTSGGTTSDFWVQTSLDGGVSWVDVAHFGPNLTASTRLIVNVESAAGIATGYVATDGSFGTTGTTTTVAGGIFGTMWRVKYTTTGTYVGTNMRIDAVTSGLTTLP